MKFDFSAVNTVATFDEADVLSVASRSGLFRKYNVLTAGYNDVKFTIDGLSGLDKAASAHFIAAWYAMESAAVAAVRDAMQEAADKIENGTEDKALADKALAAVEKRVDVIQHVAVEKAAIIGGIPNRTMALFAAAVHGRLTVDNTTPAAVAVDVLARHISTAIASGDAADLRPVMTACEKVFSTVWCRAEGVCKKSTFHCSATLARHIIAAAVRRFKLENGRFVKPSMLDKNALFTETVRAMLWYMAGSHADKRAEKEAEQAEKEAAVQEAANKAAEQEAANKRAAKQEAANKRAAKQEAANKAAEQEAANKAAEQEAANK